MKPSDKQEQEFWELCGFVKRGHSYAGKELWVAPEDIEWFDKCVKDIDKNGYAKMPEKDSYYALRPIDLNNLFKYAVPKLENYHLGSVVNGHIAIAWRQGTNFHSTDKDPALALFWAIYKALGGKE